MRVLFFENANNDTGRRFHDEIEARIPEGRKETYRSILELVAGLDRPENRNAILVLLAETRERLGGLLSIREALLEHRSILILPDRDEETIAKGHTLYPRFLTYSDGDFVAVYEVLTRIIEHMRKPQETIKERPEAAWDGRR